MKNNIDNSLIQKVDNIVKLSNDFDELFSKLIQIQDPSKINPEQINNLYEITKLYKIIRAEHGGLLILLDKKKELIKSKSSELTDELVEDLYELSTFNSIISNVSELISNNDFEFKRIAIMFPKFMNKKPLTIMLFIKNINQDNNHIKMIEETKNTYPEHIYKVFECKPGKKINCGKINGNNLNVLVKEVPCIFTINDSNMIKLPIEKINDAKSLSKYIN